MGFKEAATYRKMGRSAMTEAEIYVKLKRCEADLKKTKSPYYKRDLEKYRRRLQNELKKIRRKKVYAK